MKKILISFFTISTLMFNIAFPAFADDAKKTIDENKVHFNQISGEIKTLDDNIQALDGDINTLNSTIQSNKDKITSVENEIKTTQGKIDSTKKQVDQGQAVLSDRLRAIYKSGSYSISNYLAFIFESEGLADLLGRLNAVQKIVGADNDMITELRGNEEALQNDMKNLTTSKDEIVKLNEENNTKLKTLVDKQNTLKESKAKFDAQKAQVQSVIEENENKLIANPVSVIDSSSSSISDLQNAVSTLKGLIPQLSTDSIISKANSYISKGNSKIDDKKKAETASKAESNSNSSNNSSSGNNNSGSTSGPYLKTITAEATAYSGHTITAMGTKPVRDPNGISTIAVDPNVIPLGSKVFIPGYGVAIAADTGGVIKGNKIDLFMNSKEECTSFGRQTVTVNIISYS
ncbi:3D domain-containing protein [Clostridium sp.]|uniref:3D domain-containing protein n=1 Tax=Clostridium sp. TaxID=1506 RepID=UPI002FC5C98A